MAVGIMATGLALLASAAMALPPPGVTGALPPAQSHAAIEKIAIFGTDNRTKLPKRLETLRGSIGLIYNERTRTVCSAFCVGDDVLATASHCVFRTKGEVPPPAERFFFSRPGTAYPSTRFAGSSSGASAQQILAGTIGISTKPPIDAARDWALIKLQTPACRGKVLPVSPMTPPQIEKEAAQGKLYQAAFHRDYGRWTMAYSTPCQGGRKVEGAGGPVAERDFTDVPNLVLHVCDTGGASSGSPLLIDTPEGPKVVAINVGTFVQSKVVIEEGVELKRAPASPVANTAVSAVAFAGKLETFRSAEILSWRFDVIELQQLLAARGFIDGLLDGRFDLRLRRAIEAYEARAGLPVMGLPTRAVLQSLQAADNRPAKVPAKAPAKQIRPSDKALPSR